MPDIRYDRLFKLLEEAATLAGEFRGGLSNQFFSAEEFHAALVDSINKFKSGDNAQVSKLWLWFAPTCTWDDYVGKDGQNLANEIFEYLTKIEKSLGKY